MPEVEKGAMPICRCGHPSRQHSDGSNGEQQGSNLRRCMVAACGCADEISAPTAARRDSDPRDALDDPHRSTVLTRRPRPLDDETAASATTTLPTEETAMSNPDTDAALSELERRFVNIEVGPGLDKPTLDWAAQQVAELRRKINAGMAYPPEPTLGVQHVLLGSICLCGDWSAGCGNDIPEQWRQHVNAAERMSTTPDQTGGRADA